MEHQIRYIEFSVISNRLIESLLRERYGLCFAFDDHHRCHLPVIDHRITAFLGFSYLDRLFHRDEGCRVTKLLHQTVKQLLTHPLFGRQTHPTVAPLAEDLLLIVIYARAQGLLKIVIL